MDWRLTDGALDGMLHREIDRLDAPPFDGPRPTGTQGLSHVAGRLTSSAVRDLLATASRPDMLSLAGGIPPDEVVPTRRIGQVLRLLPAAAFQYGETAGLPELRATLIERFDVGPGRTPDDLLVTSGSQQAIDLVVRVLCDAGDVVAIDDPGYIGTLQALRSVGASILPVPVDGQGLRVDVLERMLAAGSRIKACFTVPDGGNPTGATLSVERRLHLCRLSRRYGFVIVEDTAYRPVTPFPPVALSALDPDVVTIGTVSKVLAPGLRVGWLTGPQEIVAAAEQLKQSTDLHTTSVGQHIALRLLEDRDWWRAQRRRVTPIYHARRHALLTAIETHLDGLVEVDRPTAGMFVWLRLVPGADSRQVLTEALSRRLAFVPGVEFAASPENAPRHEEALRLSISPVPPDQFHEAMQRLAQAIRAVERARS